LDKTRDHNGKQGHRGLDWEDMLGLRDIARDSRGVVLILVLSTVAMFTAMVLSFSSDQGYDIELAYNFRDSLQAYYLADAGVEAAKALLKDDNPNYDGLDEDWAKFSEYAAASSAFLDGPVFVGEITDECSKIDINSLVKEDGEPDPTRIEQLKRLFGILNIDITEDELNNLIDAIIDWLDPDDEPTGLGGAEDDFYQALDRPYVCKNRNMDTIEEILLVKGMKKEYFYGTKDYEGISKYITVGTGGKININTASKEVLMSLSDDIDDADVEDIMDHRPYKRIEDAKKEMYSVTSSPSQVDDLITVESKRFKVEVTASMPSGANLVLTAVIDRSSGTPKVVYYKIH